jgi:hypothetical protein
MRSIQFGLFGLLMLLAIGCGGPDRLVIESDVMSVRYDQKYHNYDILAHESRIRIFHSKMFFTTGEESYCFDDPDFVKTIDNDRFSDVRGEGDLFTVLAKDPWQRHDVTMVFKVYDDHSWVSVEMRLTNTSRDSLVVYTLQPLNIQPEFGGGLTIWDEASEKDALVVDYAGDGEHRLPFKDMKTRQGIYSWQSIGFTNPKRELSLVITNLTEQNMVYSSSLDQAEDVLRGPPVELAATLLLQPSNITRGNPYESPSFLPHTVASGATLSSGEILVCLVKENIVNLREFVNQIPR